jgi:hypothetical protein
MERTGWCILLDADYHADKRRSDGEAAEEEDSAELEFADSGHLEAPDLGGC